MKDISPILSSEYLDIPGNPGRQFISEILRNSSGDHFLRRSAHLKGIVDATQNSPAHLFGSSNGMPLVCDFKWRSDSVDRTDNQQQVDVLKHHYLSVLNHDISFEELKKDYRDDATIYTVMDDVPATYHGADGLRSSMNGFAAMLHAQDGKATMELQHMKIDHNHAQVTWRAETPHHTYIFGTDAFTFDKSNQIISQSVVALSQEHSPNKEPRK